MQSLPVSTPRLAFPIVSALVLLCACGGGSGGLRGTIRTAQYTVPAGETRTLSGDLVVRSTGSIVIDGTLRVPVGMSLALLADGDLTIRGKIEAAPSRARDTRQTPEPAAAVLYSGGGMSIETRGEVSPGATILAVAANQDIKIDGTLAPGDAPDGTSQTDPGDDGHDVEIGTDRAIAHLRDKLGLGTVKPRHVTITGTLRGGHGGDGFDDANGRLSGRDLIVQGTDGGDGGDVRISRTGLINGTYKGGNGGQGGDAGTA